MDNDLVWSPVDELCQSILPVKQPHEDSHMKRNYWYIYVHTSICETNCKIYPLASSVCDMARSCFLTYVSLLLSLTTFSWLGMGKLLLLLAARMLWLRCLTIKAIISTASFAWKQALHSVLLPGCVLNVLLWMPTLNSPLPRTQSQWRKRCSRLFS